jgi:hypothetical protein
MRWYGFGGGVELVRGQFTVRLFVIPDWFDRAIVLIVGIALLFDRRTRFDATWLAAMFCDVVMCRFWMGRFFADEFDLVDLEFAVFDTFIGRAVVLIIDVALLFDRRARFDATWLATMFCDVVMCRFWMGRFFADEFDLVDLEFAVFDKFIREAFDPAVRVGGVDRDEPLGAIRLTRLWKLNLYLSCPAGGFPAKKFVCSLYHFSSEFVSGLCLGIVISLILCKIMLFSVIVILEGK